MSFADQERLNQQIMKYKITLPSFIEVETSTYCNRTCLWCPNGWNSRGKERHFMVDSIWNSILEDLQKVNYSGQFAFHNYNEPLIDPTLISKVNQTRQMLKDARLSVFTNGDYLNTATFQTLADAGVNRIRVTLYPLQNDHFNRPNKDQIVTYLKRKLSVTLSADDIVREVHFHAYLKLQNVELHIIVPFIQQYHNRGGTVKIDELALPDIRREPCYLPFSSAAIDYLGNLKLCCEIYDVTTPSYEKYSVGNISEGGFLKLWFSKRMDRFRNQVSNADFTGLEACQQCRYLPDKQRTRRLEPNTA